MATPTQITSGTARKAYRRAAVVAAMAVGVVTALAGAALASDVDVAVVDVVVPTNSVTLAPGGSGTITINMSVSGAQAGTATFEVYRNWTLSGGTFVGSNPQEFTVGPRAGGDPATTFSTSGTVTVAAGQPAGAFTLAVGAFDITNSNTTGGKLAAGDSSNYLVTVTAPPPPSDTTPPSIGYTLDPASPNGANGWYTSNVTLTWSVSEPESPSSLVKTGCVDQSVTADQAEATYSCSAESAGGSAGPVSVSIKRDATKPTIAGVAAPAPNGAGWNRTDVTVSFTCGDNLSGVALCGPNETLTSEGAGQSATGTAIDRAGNGETATVSGINIDKTAPGITWNGGPADGGSSYFGSVPAAPTCTASDSLSGPNGCAVTGYSDAVGQHVLTATARDLAGNERVETRTYTVLAWTLHGFYQPVDMNGVFNTVKGGSTVPLKFEAFAGATELTDTAAVKSLTAAKVGCDASAPQDEVEATATGGTSLRYDAVAGQFVYNWQTPKTAGVCYRVTLTTQDGSSLVAYFKLK